MDRNFLFVQDSHFVNYVTLIMCQGNYCLFLLVKNIYHLHRAKDGNQCEKKVAFAQLNFLLVPMYSKTCFGIPI